MVQGLEESFEAIKLVSTFDFPEMEQPYEYVALRHPDYYAIERGTIVSTSGVTFPPSEFPKHIKEFHVEHSTALHASFDGGMYMVGPLARYTLNFEQLSDRCKEAALAAGLGTTCRNQFKSIIVRGVELAYAFEEAIRIIDGWKDGAAPSVDVKPAKGEGMGASEAPRGTIFHRYITDEDGIIQDAQIVPPTSQNQPSIELDLKTAAQQWVDLDDHSLTHRCEHAIRNYDPCISCSTHFLDLRIERS